MRPRGAVLAGGGPAHGAPREGGHEEPPRTEPPLTEGERAAIELDRWLDGEMEPGEASAFAAGLAADLGRARGARRRRAYLGALSRAGAAWRAGLAATTPADLEARVRLRLAAGRRRRPFFAAAVAATLLLGVGLWTWQGRLPSAEAVPPPALAAVDLARTLATVPDVTTCASAALDPRASVLVQDGGFEVVDCTEERGARLRRIADLDIVGWAAAPAGGAPTGPDVGLTVLSDFVVFDVTLGGRREYLAVARTAYAELDRRLGERASCFVCHRTSRDGRENPHRIGQRAWGQAWSEGAGPPTR